MSRHIEFERPVLWERPDEDTEAMATFAATIHSGDVLGTRLVRVQLGAASFGRREAMIFGQVVEAWEREADAAAVAQLDRVQIPVRVLQETDQAWLLTLEPYGRRNAYWEPKAAVEIPDLHEIKPMQTARMRREYALRRGWLREVRQAGAA